MKYTGVTLDNSLIIEDLFSVHYFEYMNDFIFDGESHDFWEFLYVDKGEVGVYADRNYFVLKKGDIIFHKPNEFHAVKATGTHAPNLVVISFSSHSPFLNFFEKRILQTTEMERTLLGEIILEARNCFSSRLDDPYLEKLEFKDSIYFASEQMLRLHLEHFLIHMIRQNSKDSSLLEKTSLTPSKPMRLRSEDDIFNRINSYLESHIRDRITIEQICKDNLIGRSQLQKIFKNHCQRGVIEYFSQLKIDTAKEMIRSKKMNFTQISEYLGYTSIHYFSRQFKKLSGMTPSEYASSIKAMSERK